MLIIAVLTVVVYAAPGDMDTTFDSNVTNPFSYGSDYGRTVAIHPTASWWWLGMPIPASRIPLLNSSSPEWHKA